MSEVPTQAALEASAGEVGRALLERGETVAVAESCTGGWLAQALTATAGSSAWFDRGFVTYSNEAKQELLDVEPTLLERHGAVSEACALAMAEGALRRSRADWTAAITGIAGPGGGSSEKPVGTVWFGFAGRDGSRLSTRQRFAGNRQAVRAQSVAFALAGLRERLGWPVDA